MVRYGVVWHGVWHGMAWYAILDRSDEGVYRLAVWYHTIWCSVVWCVVWNAFSFFSSVRLGDFLALVPASFCLSFSWFRCLCCSFFHLVFECFFLGCFFKVCPLPQKNVCEPIGITATPPDVRAAPKNRYLEMRSGVMIRDVLLPSPVELSRRKKHGSFYSELNQCLCARII